MKIRQIISVSAMALLALGLAAAVLSIPKEEPEPEPPPPTPYSVDTEALSHLVEYYNGQLDPEIPKITVTAEFEGYTLELPYDAMIRESQLESETDRNCAWFMNLMNNFRSLPQLGDGYWDPEEVIPAQFTISFHEQPESPVTIIDYMSAENLSVPYGTVVSLDDKREEHDMYYLGNYTHVFELKSELLSFQLWEPHDIGLMSTLPYMRGLRLICQYGDKTVEYYILFQTTYMSYGAEFPDYYSYSHLTPLEEPTS
ncbi:MAG: hypothetical protein ACOX6U_05985 [Oscillospiraceae bacterium]|jgi:hypothetical protein